MIIALPQDGAGGFLGGVHLEFIWLCRVGLPEDWVGGDNTDECVDGCGTSVGPNELDPLFEEASQWVGYLCESWYEGVLIAQDS